MEVKQHNLEAFNSIIDSLKTYNRACSICATGVGKSYQIYKLIETYPDKKFLFITANKATAERFIEDGMNNELDMSKVTPTVYNNLKIIDKDEIFDFIILDEFHRAGAPEWGKHVEQILNTNSDSKIVGFTATPIRFLDKHRNMAEELFYGNIVYSLSLNEAIDRGILPRPEYISVMYSVKLWNDRLNKLAEINSYDFTNSKTRQIQAMNAIRKAKKSVASCPSVNEIIKKHNIKKDGHYFVFCSRIEEIKNLKKEAVKWFDGINKVHSYEVHNDVVDSSLQLNAFLGDNSNSIKLLFCIDMLTEGIHSSNIDGAFFLRDTASPIKFFQQVGRTLSTGKERQPQIFDLVGSFGCLKAIQRKIENEAEEQVESDYLDKMSDRPYELPFDFEISDYILDIENEIKEAEFLTKELLKHNAFQSHVGEKRVMNNGHEFTITEYNNYRDISGVFDNGEVREHVGYYEFQHGSIGFPKKSHVGEKRVMKNGHEFTITAYKKNNDLDGIFDTGEIREHVTYRAFLDGYIAFPPKSHVGEKAVMKNGHEFTITEYNNSKDISGVFDNDFKREHVTYTAFLDGFIALPKEWHVGEKAVMNNGHEFTITEYNNANDISGVFDNGEVRKHVKYSYFNKRKLGLPKKSHVGEKAVMNNGHEFTITVERTNQDMDGVFDNGEVREHVRYGNFLLRTIGFLKKSYVGEKRVMNNGHEFTITKQRSAKDMDGIFDTGETREHVTSGHFLDGRIGFPKKSHVGEKAVMKNGHEFTITKQRSAKDMDGVFDTGEIRKHVTYSDFNRGSIALYPRKQSNLKIKNIELEKSHIGEKAVMKNGHEFTITKYNNANDISGVFDNGEVREHVRYGHFVDGYIAFPKKSHVGEKAVMNNGHEFTITVERTNQDMDGVFDNGEVREHVRYSEFKKRTIGLPKNNCVGEKAVMNNGHEFTITEYNNYRDISGVFDTGETREHISMLDFNRKSIAFPMKSHVGEKRVMNNGHEFTITEYNNAKDISGVFDNGETREHVIYGNFIRGIVAFPKKSHVGEKRVMNNGHEFTITEYNNHKDISGVFDNGETREHIKYYDFQHGILNLPQKSHVGEKAIMNNGHEFTITKHNNSKDISGVFDNGFKREHVTYNAFKKGNIALYPRKQSQIPRIEEITEPEKESLTNIDKLSELKIISK